ncbi:hypothetical protein [Cytobacillus firmus]|uniref:hypothetical protein n=1 Tax=Cytobacillus firmus TaxID=1399 RepID=UPI0024C1F9AA|nr:hypothetical protein [Cytobacillus firmus]WHY63250.1 hypothetical protein QNH42_07795 [Cytobacillus firmus]
MNKYKELIWVVMSLGLAALLADVARGKIESYIVIFISIISGAVMAILTFYLYKVNKKVVELNEKQLNLNARFLVHQEKKEFDKLLGQIEVYLNNIKKIIFFTLPHISVSQKKFMLEISDKDLFGNLFVLENYFREELKTKNNIKNPIAESLIKEETEDEKYVKQIYYDNLPSSVKAFYKVEDIVNTFEDLMKIREEHDFLRYSEELEFIKSSMDNLEKRLKPLLNKQDKNALLTDVDLGNLDADIIYSALIALRGLFMVLQGKILAEKNLITSAI